MPNETTANQEAVQEAYAPLQINVPFCGESGGLLHPRERSVSDVLAASRSRADAFNPLVQRLDAIEQMAMNANARINKLMAVLLTHQHVEGQIVKPVNWEDCDANAYPSYPPIEVPRNC